MKEKLIDFKQKQSIRLLFSILCVIFSALLQTYALKVFLRPAGLLSSGFTGLAILINVIGSQHQIQIPVALMIVLLNLPVAILCGKSISTKFTILSSLQFACVSIFLTVFQFDILFDDIMLNIVISGAVYGLGIVAAIVGNARLERVFGHMFLYITVSCYVSLALCLVGSVQDILLLCSLYRPKSLKVCIEDMIVVQYR